MSQPYYRQMLYAALSERCRRNPRYSLRAFAKTLGVDPGNLSRAMRGQTKLSKHYADKIIVGLGLKPKQAKAFTASLSETTSRSASSDRQMPPDRQFAEIESSYFEAIADLSHYAILELTATEGFRSDANWIAKTLGISQAEAMTAINRLKNLGLLIEDRGTWKKCTPKIRTATGINTSVALRAHQKQVLNRAVCAVDDVPVERRCNISLTMPIDPDLVETARQAIERFSNRLCNQLSSRSRRQVYQLSVALYPLQREIK